MSSSDDALRYIRGAYRVPARRNQRVMYEGWPGTITGGSGPHLIVRLDGSGRRVILHPADGVEYLQVMWRCTGCGAWSHAKRQPRKHHRFVSADVTGVVPPGATVVEVVPATYEPDSSGSGGGWLIVCGPFERWEARRV